MTRTFELKFLKAKSRMVVFIQWSLSPKECISLKSIYCVTAMPTNSGGHTQIVRVKSFTDLEIQKNIIDGQIIPRNWNCCSGMVNFI